MAITPQQRRALMVEGHHLKPIATVAAGELSDGAVAHVRAAFVGRPLVKLRVNVDSGAECDVLAEELARRVPCEVVGRLGRVLLVYRAAEPVISQDSIEAE
jgi:RNA-binding protein